jgi:peptide/nickel transport system substrate-binding protein
VLQTGDADFAYNLQVEAPVLNSLAEQGKGDVVTVFGGNMERILFNFSDPNPPNGSPEERATLKFPHPFLTEQKVREAFSLAIDRTIISDKLYGVTGKVGTNFLLAPPQYAAPDKPWAMNLDRANQLLDEAGWVDSNNNGIRDKDGREMAMVFQTSVNPLRQKTQEIVKQSLQSLGVSVELKSIDATIMFSSDPASTDTVERFYADLQMFTTGNTNPDPSSYIQDYLCDRAPQPDNNWTGDNYSRYCNPEYDALWEQVKVELNPDRRAELFKALNDLLINDYALIPLVHRAEVVGVSKQLQGVNLTPWDTRTWNIAQWQKGDLNQGE